MNKNISIIIITAIISFVVLYFNNERFRHFIALVPATQIENVPEAPELTPSPVESPLLIASIVEGSILKNKHEMILPVGTEAIFTSPSMNCTTKLFYLRYYKNNRVLKKDTSLRVVKVIPVVRKSILDESTIYQFVLRTEEGTTFILKVFCKQPFINSINELFKINNPPMEIIN